MFVLHCSICSKDKDLYPEGAIVSSKSNLKRGTIPCGCGSRMIWKEWQNLIRVKRRCTILGYKLLGWSGKYRGVTTKCILEDKLTGEIWGSTQVQTLMNFEIKPPKRRYTGNPKEDYIHIQHFRDTGRYHPASYFLRDNSRSNKQGYHVYWKFTCGMCKETHSRHVTSFKNGHLPCSCAPRFGYSEKLKDNLDQLYIINFNDEFIKIGRSFDTRKRITSLVHTSKYKREFLKILHVFEGTHEVVFNKEQEILDYLDNVGELYYTDFTKETFNIGALNGVVENLYSADNLKPIDIPL